VIVVDALNNFAWYLTKVEITLNDATVLSKTAVNYAATDTARTFLTPANAEFVGIIGRGSGSPQCDTSWIQAYFRLFNFPSPSLAPLSTIDG
jgi:hypothetical protein